MNKLLTRGLKLSLKLSLTLGLILSLGTALTALLALPIYAAPQLPGPITMNQTDKPVVFNHSSHASTDCTTCHSAVPAHFPPMEISERNMCVVCHHMVDGDLPDIGTCSSCHFELDPRDKSPESYYRIIHGRTFAEADKVSCLSCHMEVIKTRPEKRQTLTACSGSACHPKQ